MRLKPIIVMLVLITVCGARADEALQGINLSGSDVITVPNNSSFDPTGLISGDRTWEFWIKPEIIPDLGVPIVVLKKKDPDNALLGVAFVIGSSDSDGDTIPDKIALGGYLNQQVLANIVPRVSTPLTLNEWQHIAITLDDHPASPPNDKEEVILYKNGIRVAEDLTESFSETSNPGDLTLGATTSSSAFGGELDEFRIWTAARSQAEIQANMSKTTNLSGNLSKLGLQFHFDDTLPTIVDSSGNGNNGTASGGSIIASGAFIGDSASITLTSIPSNLGLFTGTDLALNITGGSFVSGGTSGVITVARIRMPHPDNTSPDVPNVSTTQFWLISHEGSHSPDLSDPTNGISALTATMTFNLDGNAGASVDEIGVGDPKTLKLLKRSTALTDWSNQGSADSSSIKSSVIFNSIAVEDSTDLIGLFTMGGDADNPLPVALASFTAQTVDEGVRLRWTTTVEWDNIGFNVYRGDSPQGSFRRINTALIPAKGGGGEYQWVDETVDSSADTYYYYIEDISRSGVATPSDIIRVSLKTNLGAISSAKPTKSALFQNFPNQFNPDTWIPYQLDQDTAVTLRIYDLKGKLIRQFQLGHQAAGYYLDRSKAVHWDGRNQNGEPVASGIYVYVLQTDGFLASKRMLLVK